VPATQRAACSSTALPTRSRAVPITVTASRPLALVLCPDDRTCVVTAGDPTDGNRGLRHLRMGGFWASGKCGR
jgi:hypothetical protein